MAVYVERGKRRVYARERRKEVMDEGNRGEEYGRRRGLLGKYGRGRGDGSVVGRSPGQLQGIRSARRRLNEEELGGHFQ